MMKPSPFLERTNSLRKASFSLNPERPGSGFPWTPSRASEAVADMVSVRRARGLECFRALAVSAKPLRSCLPGMLLTVPRSISEAPRLSVCAPWLLFLTLGALFTVALCLSADTRCPGLKTDPRRLTSSAGSETRAQGALLAHQRGAHAAV